MITKLAVRWLTWQLRKDKGLWISYQANIAMAFQDEFNRFMGRYGRNEAVDNIHSISNAAATNFMNLWTGKGYHP